MAAKDSDKKITPTDPTAPVAEATETESDKTEDRKTARHMMSHRR